MKTIIVEYVINDFVIIVDPEIRARVVTIDTNETGSFYNCQWWCDGEPKQASFYGSELRLADAT